MLGTYVPQLQQQRAFEQLRDATDFSGVMADQDLLRIADGIKRVMFEAELNDARELAEAFGHEVRERPMRLLGSTRVNQYCTEPAPIYIKEDASIEVKEFVVYHELAHLFIFSNFALGAIRQLGYREEEVGCDGFACMMIGREYPPEGLEPMDL